MHTFHYVVGDIHGCFAELRALEGQIQEHAARQGAQAIVVSVGDLIDRGAQSEEVVRHFLRGQEAGTHFAVGGNHEASLFEVCQVYAPQVFLDAGLNSHGAESSLPLPRYAIGLAARHRRMESARHLDFEGFCERMKGLWFAQGGKETLWSFGCDPEQPQSWKIEPELFRYLFDLPLLWECHTAVVTHAYAGPAQCESARLLDAEPAGAGNCAEEFMADIDAIIWNRVVPIAAPFDKKIHVSGHTPRKAAQYWKELRTVALDTGCAYGNALTAWCCETEEFLVELGPGSDAF